MKSCSKRIETLCLEKIGKSELKIFTEKIESSCKLLKKTEFIFEIDSSTKKKTDFSIFDLKKIRYIVKNVLNEYIQDRILKEVSNLSFYQLIVEIEGNDQKEVEMKHVLYDTYLDKLAKNLNEVVDKIFCIHSKDNLTHYLTFSYAGKA